MASRIFNLQDLGRHFRQERKARNLSQLELANLAKLSRQTIINLEKGEEVGTLTLLKALQSMGMTLNIDTIKPDFSEIGALLDEA